ncbi:cobyrinate a,c-diamide synthase [Gloeocapsa sp. PCC 73106]|uniref:cobyrinate a,c-diamide synthase n=1 Tax=Gloeocapsa sp. PCC 73106 TaxID=102232 RepID=UPI0002ACF244|nr:cobyrinate a,c-diamide synthase [Gloeocapsa sp. PCC 73106]ELR97908.1 cobyrinic acid a,c-diamide synthase [Gloeocapsa sp. PCC 73106]
MGLVIAGCRSGEGKTTVALALLSYLVKVGTLVQSFKVGPDYIDPMYHSRICDRPCRNLDPVLTGVDYVRSCFAHHCRGVNYALIEGVMGLFDGINRDNIPDFASTAHIARILSLPVLLVIDCSRLSGSVAAIAHGYRSLDPRVKLAGVILNKVASDRHLELLTSALEPLNLPVLGILRRQDLVSFPSRHLGLVNPGEIAQFRAIIDKLAFMAECCFDLSKILPLMQVSNPTEIANPLWSQITIPAIKPRIVIARDRAFNFYYQDNLDILQDLGAELIFWSPLEDTELPENIQGIYIGGGYPEVFAEELAANELAKEALKLAIAKGLTTYAECGGLMYLSQQITNFEQKSWSMVGILPTSTIMSEKLTLGYRKVETLRDNIILSKGSIVWGHEFHRSQITTPPVQPVFKINNHYEGWHIFRVHASYLHLHFGGYPKVATNFLKDGKPPYL